MRTLFILLISLLSITSHAQKFMVGVQGGVMINSAPLGMSDYFENYNSSPQMLVAGKLGLDTRKIQAGIGCNLSSLEFYRENKLRSYTQYRELPFSYEHSALQINPFFFVNIKRNLVRSFFYYGANLGYTIFNSTHDLAYLKSTSVAYSGTHYNSNGLTIGIQAGFRLKLLDGLGAMAEAGAKYTTATPSMGAHDFYGIAVKPLNGDGMFYFPLTLGIDYIF
jgi:hypothetical protein